MTPLASRIAAHLERMYHEHGWVLVGYSAFERQSLADADTVEGLAALRELVADGIVSAEVEVRCGMDHCVWTGPEASKPSSLTYCRQCHAEYEPEDIDERVRFSLTPSTIERLKTEVPFAPSVYARGLQAAEGCREIERLVQGLVRVLGLVRA